MSLPQRLTPITTRLAHILTARKTSQNLAARSSVATAPLAIYFGGSVGDIYQVSQWTPIFEKFSNELPSVLLVKDARAASALAKLTNLPIRLAGHADAIEPLVDKFGIKAMFYVNNNLGNFSVLRLTAVTHIHLSHGESEKVSMVSNQLKAYDFCFVAGQASVDRILGSLDLFDPAHLIKVGRPQLDALLTATPFTPVRGRKTVLYAPTWEGDRQAMAYSSLPNFGESWVKEILNDSTLRLIYRPHPKTGSRDSKTLKVDRAIRKAIENAAKNVPTSGHLVDDQTNYNPALVSADIAIFDISAMSLDYQVLHRPMFVYDRAGENRMIPELPTLDERQAENLLAGNIVQLLHLLISEELITGTSMSVINHFGDVTQGASLRILSSEIKRLLKY